MPERRPPKAAIVDFGMGNLYSVQQACRHAGLEAAITGDPKAVAAADGVILPGVGAFADAIGALEKTGLASAIRDGVAAGKPLLGICLGMQLLMTESHEFGRHAGLGLIPGQVLPLESPDPSYKIPQVGWNRVKAAASWAGTPLEGVSDGAYMYFVHSYRVVCELPEAVVATTRYGKIDFCSSLARGSVFACQYHPERSGPRGVAMYGAWAARLHAGAAAKG